MNRQSPLAEPKRQGSYPIIHPDYAFEKWLAPRHQGNPAISGLPLGQMQQEELWTLFDLRPTPPTDHTRRLHAMARLGELHTMKDLVYVLPQYQQAASAVIQGLRETYVGRNPVSSLDRHRRFLVHQHASFNNQRLHVPLPPRLRLTATSLGMFGPPGAGKSTFANTLCPHFQVAVRHSTYGGMPFVQDQLPLIYLQVPHDSTVKSFCQSFLGAIDDALGYTNYYAQGGRASGIGEMVILMIRAATSVSLGGLFIDDFQNLRVAKGPAVVIMLNLLSGLIEQGGVSVFTSGTPSVHLVFQPGTANHRKLTLSGDIAFPLLKRGSRVLDHFMNEIWKYRYVQQYTPLSPTIKDAWYDAGAGNPHFMLLAFMLAQRNAIGSKELIDEVAFAKASVKNMAALRPAVRAMLDGSVSALQAIDGMQIGGTLDLIHQELGLPSLGATAYPMPSGDDFPEVEKAMDAAERPSRGKAPQAGKAPALKAPEFDDPLLMR